MYGTYLIIIPNKPQSYSRVYISVLCIELLITSMSQTYNRVYISALDIHMLNA
jgi:hypothetical protein